MKHAPSQSIFFGFGDPAQYSGRALSRQVELHHKPWSRSGTFLFYVHHMQFTVRGELHMMNRQGG
jgi:hypothetical protein